MISKNPSFDVFRNYIEPVFSEERDPTSEDSDYEDSEGNDPQNQSPIDMQLQLPVSGKTITAKFGKPPTPREVQDYMTQQDIIESLKLGRLHPSVAKSLSASSVDPNEIFRAPLEGRLYLPLAHGNRGTVRTSAALTDLGKLLGVQDVKSFYDPSSPDYQRAKAIVNLWNEQSKASPGGGMREQIIKNRWHNPADPGRVPLPEVHSTPSAKKSKKTRGRGYILGDLSRDNVLRFTMHEIEGVDETNDKGDPGGWTKYGIAENYDQEFLPGPGSYGQKVRALTEDRALQIHIQKYWNRSWNGLPAPSQISNPKLAYAVFDAALNSRSESLKPIRQIMKNPQLTDDQKADAIFDQREHDFAHNKRFAKGLINRIHRIRRFMDGREPE